MKEDTVCARTLPVRTGTATQPEFEVFDFLTPSSMHTGCLCLIGRVKDRAGLLTFSPALLSCPAAVLQTSSSTKTVTLQRQQTFLQQGQLLGATQVPTLICKPSAY